MSQLPLREGRPVAFRPPTRNSKPKDGGETEYIQARVVRCLQPDRGEKAKYEVQDVQDESGIEGKPGA